MNKFFQYKLFVVLLIGILAAFLVTGCSGSETEASSQVYKAGTYTSKVYGYLSYLTIETSFSESEITNITVSGQNETPALFSLVEAQVPGDIIKYQSLAVDTVSGASLSSMAVIQGVSENVKQAGGDPAVLRMVQVPKTPGEEEEYSTDIVVVGVGASGFMAAHNAAQESGVEVMAIEKGAGIATSNGIKVSGPFAVDTSVLRAQNSKLTVDKAFYHMMDYNHWSVNAGLVRKCLEESFAAVPTTRL